MKNAAQKAMWLIWLALSVSLAGYYGYVLLAAEDKSELLIGEATHGHFQIELACSSCHTEAFGGGEILQNACVDCHGDELAQSHDSHPRKKFTDPRNADLLKILDARQCVSCHTEHQAEQTRAMGVTVPDDYCYHCHQDVADHRPSHQGLEYDSCASAGCHNYHDNRALYEDFLVGNAGGPWLNTVGQLANANGAGVAGKPLSSRTEISAQDQQRYPDITLEWSQSGHAQAGVDCATCHRPQSSPQQWIEKPDLDTCQSCHGFESESFFLGKHGMKLAAGMGAITPEQSSLDFHAEALQQGQGCSSCHTGHDMVPQTAALDSCLGCHADEHSVNFLSSPHAKLGASVISSETQFFSESVTCATCHLPRVLENKPGHHVGMENLRKLDKTNQSDWSQILAKKGMKIRVDHNQNNNLRPNEKMIRSVCMACHSLEFSIDALADEALIKSNFNGQPGQHVPSVDWATDRIDR